MSPQASSSTAYTQGLLPILIRAGRFHDTGRRLQLLAQLYATTDHKPSRSLPGQFARALVTEIGEVDRDELSLLASALRDMPVTWRSRRTDIEVAIFRFLEDPEDLDDWRLLRDILDIIPTTPEYEDDLGRAFEGFVDERLAEIKERLLDENIDGNDADALRDLEELADRWDVSTDVADLVEQAEEMERAISSKLLEYARDDPNQPMLFDDLSFADAGAHSDAAWLDHGAIFDGL
jgi:hypothetical protein